jgi:hypothetical protein
MGEVGRQGGGRHGNVVYVTCVGHAPCRRLTFLIHTNTHAQIQKPFTYTHTHTHTCVCVYVNLTVSTYAGLLVCLSVCVCV